MIRADDSQTINPSEFSSKVGSGVVLEMTIVLRRNYRFEENAQKCPRCRHMNLNVATCRGWIEWKVSQSFVRVVG